MLKSLKNLLNSKPFKGKVAFVKKILASNLAFAAIALPLNSLPSISLNSSDLIIPQDKLNIAFNIEAPKKTDYQIPLDFIYMSQGFSSYHPAIDLATKFGTQIYPIKPGVVEFAGFTASGYGNEVLIDHGNGIESLYAHLSKIKVKVGDVVEENDVIGLVGTTGHSTGPHLHLEIHQDGKNTNPLKLLPSITINSGHLLTSVEITSNQQ